MLLAELLFLLGLERRTSSRSRTPICMYENLVRDNIKDSGHRHKLTHGFSSKASN